MKHLQELTVKQIGVIVNLIALVFLCVVMIDICNS